MQPHSHMRVQKLLSSYGYCSRRKAEDLIEKGLVRVNGEVISLGDKACAQDQITVDGKAIHPQKKVYLIFHKPHGCVTAVSDARYKTVLDHIKIPERIFPVGRLDYNTTGLLLLTSDGDFANQVMHPRYEIKKTYRVTLDAALRAKDRKALEEGVMLDDGITYPSTITDVKDYKVVDIVIHEGKNRIVRRMFAALGYDVKELKRIKIGSLELGDLKVGRYRHMSEHEKRAVFRRD